MVRLFQVYYPVRTLVLFASEAAVVCASFLAAAIWVLGPDAYIALNYEGGLVKILAITFVVVLFSYYFDLYAPQLTDSSGETYFRLLAVLGMMSFALAGVSYVYPDFEIAHGVYFYGLVLLTFGLSVFRAGYLWVIRQPFLQERVYILGAGNRAKSVVDAIRQHRDWGMEVVGWAGALGNGSLDRDDFSNLIVALKGRRAVDRVIVAMDDRRNRMPVRELLDLRLSGVRIEDATDLLEKTSGRIEIDGLHPSALIFGEGFRLNSSALLARRIVSTLISFIGLVLCLPIIPLVALAVRLDSKGPVFFKQERVGRGGETFWVYKFRTMRQDAEAGGAKWAGKDDPRITRIGKFLRKTRLDEIPQLWNVLKGDMSFVGPRPERPEFVQWLNEAIPYYNMRHIIRPGLTGWAQVRYEYGASLEQTKEKLTYDLYYVKHMSLALDLLIAFETIKIVLLRRGSR